MKVLVDGRVVIDWVVETYNPFFGCIVGYLAWHGDRVVVIYREKHKTYACSLPSTGRGKALVQIADKWAVVNEQICFRSDEPHFAERLVLPELRPLGRISSTEARETDRLPPGYDQANEAAIRIGALLKKRRGFRFF